MAVVFKVEGGVTGQTKVPAFLLVCVYTFKTSTTSVKLPLPF